MITVVRQHTAHPEGTKEFHTRVDFSDGSFVRIVSMGSEKAHQKAVEQEIKEALYEKNQNLAQLEIEQYIKTYLPVNE